MLLQNMAPVAATSPWVSPHQAKEAAQRRIAAQPLQPQTLRLELGANLSGRVSGAVDVHIQIAGLEAGVLLIRQF
jgi:hypothetical protein